MAIAKIESPPTFDMGSKIVPWEKRHAAAKELRRAVPRESLARWTPWKGRPDPLKLLAASTEAGRRISFRCAWDAWPPPRSHSCGARLA